MMNSMLQAGLSVATNLYAAKSLGAAKAATGAAGLKDYGVSGYSAMAGITPASTTGGITSYGTSYGNAAGWEKIKW